MSPLVSVIVPFFNVGELLDECLASIAAQTYSNLEILLVDDGSTDDSTRIAEQWLAKDSRFRLERQENKGPGPSRNAALKLIDGEFFMFVDGDDLLAPRAIEQLLASLQQSGSDFAGAQVWRLPLTRPVEKSYAHVEPFADFRQGTSIREIPLLMRDRMVWNKLWRRSFWAAGGYEFPDMLFEDFPVLLRAHFDATSIDTLPDPVYVWRERPKGESISVRGDALGNVTDRVVAAEMCLDIVDSEATTEVRELVHSHLVDVDLREVMGSLLTIRNEDQPAVEALAHRLAQRIDPACVALAAPDLRTAYRAAREKDMTTLRALAEKRASTGPSTRSRTDLAKRAPGALAKRATKVAQKASPTRARSATLVGVDFAGETIIHRLAIPVNARIKRGLTVTARLGDEPLTVTSVPTGRGFLCDVEIPAVVVARHGGFQPLTVDVTGGPIHFSGHVSAPTDLLEGFRRGGYWYHGVLREGHYGLERKRDAAVITSARLVRDAAELTVSRSRGELVVEQPWPTNELRYPIVDGVATLPLADIAAADPADNPVTKIASRRLSVADGEHVTPLLLAAGGVRTVVGEREIEIRRSDDASAFLVHRPA